MFSPRLSVQEKDDYFRCQTLCKKWISDTRQDNEGPGSL